MRELYVIFTGNNSSGVLDTKGVIMWCSPEMQDIDVIKDAYTELIQNGEGFTTIISVCIQDKSVVMG